MIKRIVQVLKIGAYFIFGFCSGFCVGQDILLLAVSIDTIIEKSRNLLKQSGIKKQQIISAVFHSSVQP